MNTNQNLVKVNQTDGGRSSDGFTHEKNDCTVRAVALTCGVPYAQAHDELKSRGRRDGKGFYLLGAVERNPVICGKRLVPVYDQRRRNGKCICLVTAQKLHPQGRYIVRMSGHAFAVIDGAVHDSGCLSKWVMVKQMWRVEDATGTSEAL